MHLYTTPKQDKANRLAQELVPIQPCEKCGKTDRVHRHHDDYDKPLGVRFLCPKHHKEVHYHQLPTNSGKLYQFRNAEITSWVLYNRRYIREADLDYIATL